MEHRVEKIPSVRTVFGGLIGMALAEEWITEPQELPILLELGIQGVTLGMGMLATKAIYNRIIWQSE